MSLISFRRQARTPWLPLRVSSSALALLFLTPFLFTTARSQVAPADEPIHLLFVGDMMHHKAQDKLAGQHKEGRVAGYLGMWEPVGPRIQAADLAVANLECPITGGPISHYPRFNGPPEYLQALRSVGFDVLTLANNHAMDKGLEGFGATFGNVVGAGMLPAGDGRPVRVIVKGRTVSILSVTMLANQGANWKVPEGRVGPYLVRYRLADERAGLVKRVREMALDSDLVVVSFHWGIEYVRDPPRWIRAWARELAEAGADVIIGHHPHVAGPIEWITREDGKQTLVAYSLGNFSSGMIRGSEPLGYILELRVSADGRLNPEVRMIWTAADSDNKRWRSFRTVMVDDLEADCAERAERLRTRTAGPENGPLMSRTGAAPHECQRYRNGLVPFKKFRPGTIADPVITP
ncbi:MAG TPA: CapA family protein [Myxococcota bacterium]|nr:CapA family protein [Myxococcota bacterium]HNZ04020.1 CapA family protein [Myxococcota bacterium]HOD07070.1 CapA family protein [Myxococcota bacterium]HPB51210.1 CapA family protein [Myxococcota bacterium]HQP96099.1 CapA family protein [Myxococcota bacterium]